MSPAQGEAAVDSVDIEKVAAALQVNIGLLVRRLRQVRVPGDLTMPETAALSRLDRGGPSTSGALAKLDQISPQSMGATLGSLQQRGLVEGRPDPTDGRRVVLSITDAGLDALNSRRSARVGRIAEALSTGFTGPELTTLLSAAPLIERLAHSL